MLQHSDAFFSQLWSFITGVIMSVIGYFLPVKDIVHLILLFFILDVIFGYWAARRTRGENFSAKIIWNTTIPRMVLSLVLILGAFMWDTTFGQDYIATYKIVGWFIAGILLFSIGQNGYQITRWRAFRHIGDAIEKKLGTEITTKDHERNS